LDCELKKKKNQHQQQKKNVFCGKEKLKKTPS